MANTVDSNTATGSVEPVDASASTLLTRAGWGLFTVAYLAFAVLTVATVQTGTHGDPRTTNPTPGPVPYPPFLGFDNWPLVVAFSSIPMALGLIGSLVWLSVRQRRLHWAVVIAFAGLITGALDPLANWATFAMFDPRMLHFPRSWPYMNISPNLEPALSFLGVTRPITYSMGWESCNCTTASWILWSGEPVGLRAIGLPRFSSVRS